MNVLTKRCAGLFFTGAFFLCGCAVVNPPDDVPFRESLKGIAITEINYNPVAQGDVDGDEFEFIEIKNVSSTKIALNKVAFTSGVDFTFPSGAVIDPGQFIVLASNSKEFAAKYGFEPFGVYTGKLNNTSERISLRDIEAAKDIITIEYSDQNPWPQLADGKGRTLVPANNEGSASSPSFWRSSFKPDGSPGKDDPNVVYINEVLAHTDAPLQDAVELYNPNGVPVDISGWYLTDNKADPDKFKFPAGTLISAKEYKVIYSDEFNDPSSTTAFNFSEHGDNVYLSSDSTGGQNGFSHGFKFGENENGISIGRYVSSTGEEQFVTQKSLTLESENAGPMVGPVTINEIMYNPKNGRDEYIELQNISDLEVPLYDTANPEVSWKIDEINLIFPSGTVIGGGGKILIITNAISPSDFRKLYSVPENVQIFCKTTDLADIGATLTLLKPLEPYLDTIGTTIKNVQPFTGVEKITYSAAGAWPKEANGQGMSLQKISNSAYSNDPANWKAGRPSPGR